MGLDIGFIYVIRDHVLRRLYLGKKGFRGTRGSKRGKESDWRYYKSSSPVVKEMLKQRPSEEFDFVVLDTYRTKAGLNYAETWTLCYVEAPTTEEWYNTRVEAVSWNVKERISERHKERLARVLRWESFEDG